MGLLDILKAAMGLETQSQTGSTTTTDSPQQDVDVTVEHEPDTTSEDAVKGTDDEDSEPAAGTETEQQDDTEDEADESEADAESEAETPDLENADDAVDTIKGIGPSYADKLDDAGIDTVDDLVSMGAEPIAAETDISEKRAQRWIDRARGEE